eukprot:6615242-Prymnesium_polylepis.1
MIAQRDISPRGRRSETDGAPRWPPGLFSSLRIFRAFFFSSSFLLLAWRARLRHQRRAVLPPLGGARARVRSRKGAPIRAHALPTPEPLSGRSEAAAVGRLVYRTHWTDVCEPARRVAMAAEHGTRSRHACGRESRATFTQVQPSVFRCPCAGRHRSRKQSTCARSPEGRQGVQASTAMGKGGH